MSRTRLIGIAITVTALAAVSVAAPASAASPRAALTKHEYAQLSDAIAAAKHSQGDLGRLAASCNKVDRSTALLGTQRSNCTDTITVYQGLAKFPAEQKNCAAKAGGLSAVAGMSCQSPFYQALGNDAELMYSSALAERKTALARGFTGTCLATLAPTSAQLGQVKRFAATTETLATDVVLMVKVLKGQAPSIDVSQTQVQSDAAAFEKAFHVVYDQKSPSKLSVCPHD